MERECLLTIGRADKEQVRYLKCAIISDVLRYKCKIISDQRKACFILILKHARDDIQRDNAILLSIEIAVNIGKVFTCCVVQNENTAIGQGFDSNRIVQGQRYRVIDRD